MFTPGPTPDVQAGFQATVCFPAGKVAKETAAIDVADESGLGVWRISAMGLQNTEAVLGRLIYGTSSSLQLENIVLPLVAYVPGNAELYLRPLETGELAEQINVRVSLKKVGGFAVQVLRTFHNAASAPINLPSSSVRFTARQVCSVESNGFNVPLAINESIALSGPSVLLNGSGIVDHEL